MKTTELNNGVTVDRRPLRYSVAVVEVKKTDPSEWTGQQACFGGKPYGSATLLGKCCREGDAARWAFALAALEHRNECLLGIEPKPGAFRQYLVIFGRKVLHRFDYRDCRDCRPGKTRPYQEAAQQA
jgi:hypothetical protein